MDKSTYKNKYNNASTGLFKDNTTGDIEAVDTRALVTDTADNFINIDSDGEKYIRQGTASGTDTYAVTVTSPNAVYTTRNLFLIVFTNGSTGACTLNVDSGGARKIYTDPSTQAGSGDIAAGMAYMLRYDTALDGGSGGFLITSGGGGGGGSQDLEEVLTVGNDAGGVVIENVGSPVDSGDATNKGYVDSAVSGLTQDLSNVLGQGNNAGGVIITGLPAPSAGGDATNKTYVDSVASGSTQLADFTALVDAAPVAVDCNSLKEPKFYLETGTSRTLNITEVRAESVLNNYTTIIFLIKKTVAGDITITLDSDYTNKDMSTSGSVSSYLLTGADESYFWLTAVVHGETSGCIMFWNLVSVDGGGGGGLWGTISGTITDQTDLVTYVDSKVDALVTTASHAGSYTLAAGDLTAINQGQALVVTGDSTGTLTVPTNATVAFPVGTLIGVRAYNNVAASGGVTVTGTNGGLTILSGETAVLEKTGTNSWILSNGSVAASATPIEYYGATSGTNTYTVTLSPALSALATGVSISVKFSAASTGASTLNANGLGAKKIYTAPSTQAGNGSLAINQIYILTYDATLDSASGGWLLTGGGASSGGGTWGSITGTLSSQSDLQTALDAKMDKSVTANRQTASYALVLDDNNKLIEMNVASSNNLTVPPNASVAFPIGAQVLLSQYGAGQTTVVPDSGVTVRSYGGRLKLSGQYSGASLVKIGTNEWYLFGDITT